MPGLQATEPMYSLYGTVRATAIGSHYGFVGKRIIETKHFIYCTQKGKDQYQGFRFAPENALNLVKTLWKLEVPFAPRG